MTDVSQILIYVYGSLQGCILLATSFVGTLETLEIFNKSIEKPTFKKFVKTWGKAVWKMRNVYASILVHIFDFLQIY